MTAEDMEFFERLFRSLETEMHKEFADVNARLTQMSNRMDRIGGLVNGGSRAIAKLAEWSERTDVTTADLLHRVAEIDQRLRRLEGKKDQA